MTMIRHTVAVLLGLVVFNSGVLDSRAQGVPKEYRSTVRKALEWIAKNQQKDGHWASNGNQYAVAMTGLAGMALLAEGSTLRSGKYSKNIRRATEWLMIRSNKGGNRDGLIGDTSNPSERSRYMYGHGFALMFLASVYGEEQDEERRERLKDILTRAVKYTVNAQSSRGGWYYTSKAEGGDNDEGSVTITQVQALRAARNAGIEVPAASIKGAYKYLKLCTSPSGGVYYSFRSKNERPAITAAAVACVFNAGEYDDPLGKQWLKYCQRTIPMAGGGAGVRIGHDEYTHYYFAQCVYVLGDDRWDKLFKNSSKEKITWSSYRKALFTKLKQSQSNDGSWTQSSYGQIYPTALYATIMQLDKGVLPIYQR